MSDEFESSSKTSSVPRWDGKKNTAGRYLAKIEAVTELNGLGDALDPTRMKECPTKLQYDSLSSSPNSLDPTVKEKIRLYKTNVRVCAMIVIGQDSDHGLDHLNKTKSTDYPQGLAWKALKSMKSKEKPGDAAAEINFLNELNAVKFKNAKDYYNDIIAVKNRYDVSVSEKTLIQTLATQVSNTVFCEKIVDHLDQDESKFDFEKLCTSIGKIQGLQKAGEEKKSGKGKEVQLNANEQPSGDFKGKCGNCGLQGHKRKDCKKPKKNGGRGGGNSNKTCNHCGDKGHLEDGSWKKHPHLAPEWYQKKNGSNEASGACLEIMMSSVESSAEEDDKDSEFFIFPDFV